MISTTAITTHEAVRIGKRLLNHWKHKFEVSETVDPHEHIVYSIFMPDATVKLTALEEALTVEIMTQREDYSILKKVVIDHLNRMAQQEFSVQWQHSPES